MPAMASIRLEDLVRFLHVGVAFVFVAALLGRDLVLARARRSDDVAEIARTAGPFERIVRPSSTAVLVLGLLTMWAEDIPLWSDGTRWVTVSLVLFLSIAALVPTVFLPRGRVFERALRESTEAGGVLPPLRAALDDRGVAFARTYETVVVGVVIFLMVVKPF
jgi:uncharacterized membrane protein